MVMFVDARVRVHVVDWMEATGVPWNDETVDTNAMVGGFMG